MSEMKYNKHNRHMSETEGVNMLSRYDGTGPYGYGPLTGRGFGFCAGHPGWHYGAGYGRRFGPRRGWGPGYGYGPGLVLLLLHPGIGVRPSPKRSF